MSLRRLQSCKGFTLLEILVSLFIVGVVSIGLAQSFITQMRFNTRSEVRSQALQIAQRVLDNLRTTDPGAMPSSGSAAAQNFTMDQRRYQAIVTYCAIPSLCSSNSRHLRVRVNYRGTKVYEIDTIFSQLR